MVKPLVTTVVAVIIALVVGAGAEALASSYFGVSGAQTVTQTLTTTLGGQGGPQTITRTVTQSVTQSTSSYQNATVRLGVNGPYESNSIVAVAQKMGIFKKYGLNIVTTMGTSNQLATALAGGSLDMGIIGTFAVLSSAEKGFYMPILNSLSNDGVDPLTGVAYLYAAIAAAPNVNGPPDLKGKTIATAGPGTVDYFMMRNWVSASGVDPNSVNWITMPPDTTMISALAKGNIQAFFSSSLLAQQAANLKVGKVLSVDPGPLFYNLTYFSFNSLVTNPTFLSQSPDVVHRVAMAFSDAAQWIMIYRQKWLTEILPGWSGLNTTTILSMPDNYHNFYLPYPDGWTDGLPIIRNMVTRLQQIGLISGSVDASRLLTVPWFTPSH